ncbi:hypothetical protein GIB67_010759 [Kingdonia uniflora]|uniref:TLC domain-containing protein n=1 Tax=Kingdonia uniflora TaxID=39325 RepID=A0A7J7L8V9_9MAGN|nr:hypothetical protein GIB67_010759 [Kingdonia uniflora]
MESESIWTQKEAPDTWHFLIAVYSAFGFVAARFILDKFIYQDYLDCDGGTHLLSNNVCAVVPRGAGDGVLTSKSSHNHKDSEEQSIRRLGFVFYAPRFAIWLLNSGSGPAKITKTRQSKILKCSESMWKLTYYATVEVCILTIIYHEPWFRDAQEYFRGWPGQEMKFPLKLVYMCQCGFYLYSIAALLTWETRRKDFSIMMSHHVITVFLIGYSYITRARFVPQGFCYFTKSKMVGRKKVESRQPTQGDRLCDLEEKMEEFRVTTENLLGEFKAQSKETNQALNLILLAITFNATNSQGEVGVGLTDSGASSRGRGEPLGAFMRDAQRLGFSPAHLESVGRGRGLSSMVNLEKDFNEEGVSFTSNSFEVARINSQIPRRGKS